MVTHKQRLLFLATLAGFSLYFGIYEGQRSIQHLIKLNDFNISYGSNSLKVAVTSEQYCSSRLPSKSWIAGERHGNTPNTDLLGRETLVQLLLGTSSSNSYHPSSSSSGLSDEATHTILSQTMSHPRSRFLNTSDRNVDDDVYRLMFLALHHHQHRPAQKEARDRLMLCPDALTHLPVNVGLYNYECPTAKYIVTYVPSYGLGMSLKHTVVDAMLLGIVTDRIVLVINSLNTTYPEVPRELKSQWELASCDRHDMQCVFLPVSPCVLTIEDLMNATHVDGADIRTLRRTGVLDGKYETSKVIILPTNHQPMPKPPGLLERIEQIIREELLSMRPSLWDMSMDYLDLVFETLVPLQKDKIAPTIWQLEDAAVLYLLRLNVEYRDKLQAIMDMAFPSDFNPEATIGLAIRSSDKCLQESECLSFDNYTTIAYNIAQTDTQRFLQSSNSSSSTHLNTSNGLLYDTIVLTSESAMILESRKSYENVSSFPFRFIVNPADVMQGSGNPGSYKSMQKMNVTADDIMFSTVSSIAFQMMCKVVVANLCSNFHKMMIGFIHRGLSAAYNPIMSWLQENEIPEFRICCAWSGSDECNQRRQAGKFGANFKRGQDVGNPNTKL
jgi:hypothetical protein